MSDLISRADAIDAVMKHKMPFTIQQEVAREIDELPSADAYTEQQIRDAYNCGYSCGKEQTKESLSAPSDDLISRADAMAEFRECVKRANENGETPTWNDAVSLIGSLPSAEAVDCTDFINWLTEEVMDEEMWELNAVANGEIICRKLEKLGVLEVTEEPSYYIRHIENNTKPSDLVYRPSADAVDVVHDIPEYCRWSQTYTNTVQSAMADTKSAEAVQGWIPCSERLPSDSGDYLVWLEDESDHYAVIPFDADAGGFGWWQDYYHPVSLGFLDSEFIEAENVTAWQPLPKPYREDGEA